MSTKKIKIPAKRLPKGKRIQARRVKQAARKTGVQAS